MTQSELTSQVLLTWHRHNQILLYLLSKIPKKGFAAIPTGSRGRTVLEQFIHIQASRTAWLHYHRTGERLTRFQIDKSLPTSPAQLKKTLSFTGKDIEQYLRDALNGNVQIRMFGKQPVRWMGYLIAHESHHRGQIMLALKQSGMRQPESVSINGLWGQWIFGK
jgi:uncharacterized damage-inducible protein DinB